MPLELFLDNGRKGRCMLFTMLVKHLMMLKLIMQQQRKNC
uniref:Uncharacterized protein n=1 Tax=Arundo donax TaxID=35708 RepID=A0A0A9C9Z1_ARUDO